MEKLQQFGLGTLEQLAVAPPNTKVPEMQPETFAVLRSQASLQLSKRMSGENKIELLPQEPGRGFTLLPRPDVGDLFFDMEGDPYYPDAGLVIGSVCSWWNPRGTPTKKHLRLFSAGA